MEDFDHNDEWDPEDFDFDEEKFGHLLEKINEGSRQMAGDKRRQFLLLQQAKIAQQAYQRMVTLLTPEHIDAHDWERQHANAIATLRAFGLSPDIEPTMEAVKRAFPIEEEAAILDLKTPVLLIEPLASADVNENFSSFVRAIDESGSIRYPTSLIGKSFAGVSPTSHEKKSAVSWRPFFVEATPIRDQVSADDTDMIVTERIRWFRERNPGMNRNEFALFTMHGMRTGTNFDIGRSTILSGDKKCKGNNVVYGSWDERLVSFFELSGHLRNPHAGFHKVVRGNIIGTPPKKNRFHR